VDRILVAAALSLLGGGGELALAEPEPTPATPSSGAAADAPSDDPAPPVPEAPSPAGPMGVAAGAAALAAILARRERLSPSGALSLEAAPLIVFVPGHGQPHGSTAFADLVEHMALDEESARYFDYRSAGGGNSPSLASQSVPVEAAASALNAYVAGVADGGRPVYLVGFSKGGATIAELVADWDRGRWGPSDAVIGAALLDPPIASGAHGWLQSLGRRIGPVPDDGGYDPVRCRFLGFGCVDSRAGLGDESGVDVVVVRNPKAGVTSFADVPPGLRVFDAPDDGPTLAGQLGRNPLALPGRIARAHEAVLHDRRVADCIVAELRSGRCDLPRRRPPPRLPSLRRQAIRAPSGQRVL